MVARLVSKDDLVAGLLRSSMWIAIANRMWLLLCMIRLPQVNTDMSDQTAA